MRKKTKTKLFMKRALSFTTKRAKFKDNSWQGTSDIPTYSNELQFCSQTQGFLNLEHKDS